MIHKLNINSWLEYAMKDGLQTKDLASNSSVYQNYCKERDEIEKHKWLESEKAGKDIGFDKTLVDWISYHRSNWRKTKLK